ncbi:MAG TPA: Spy/CpxP family protein refolding chaperone [Burkholderiales bacterium]|nr:Spy/CpxP family protein refolding chaperone [Burkholderiales bacterium]
MNKRQLFQALLASGAALASAWSFAQFGGGRRNRAGQGGGDGSAGGRGGARREPTPMLEVMLHEFQEDLKLRPDQEPLFEAYAEKVRDLAADVARERRQPAAATTLGLLQRIDHNVDTIRNRLAGVEEIADAARALLAKLSAEQQVSADPRLANLMLLPLAGAGAGGAPGRAGGGPPGGGGPDAK